MAFHPLLSSDCALTRGIPVGGLLSSSGLFLSQRGGHSYSGPVRRLSAQVGAPAEVRPVTESKGRRARTRQLPPVAHPATVSLGE